MRLRALAIAGLAMLTADGSGRQPKRSGRSPITRRSAPARARMRTRAGPHLSGELALPACRPAGAGGRGVQAMAQGRGPRRHAGVDARRAAHDRRTAIVRGPQPLEMHERASSGTKLLWRAAPASSAAQRLRRRLVPLRCPRSGGLCRASGLVGRRAGRAAAVTPPAFACRGPSDPVRRPPFYLPQRLSRPMFSRGGARRGGAEAQRRREAE